MIDESASRVAHLCIGLLVACAPTAPPPKPAALPAPKAGVTEPASTASTSSADPTVLIYRYDGELGKCIDDAGNTGFNTAAVADIVRRRTGDCVDLGGRDLSREDARLAGLTFRGADLNNTKFGPYGAPKVFDGADIRGAVDVYTNGIQGRIDKHTLHDDHCVRSKDGTRVHCSAPR